MRKIFALRGINDASTKKLLDAINKVDAHNLSTK